MVPPSTGRISLIDSASLTQTEAARLDFLQGLRLRNYEKHVALLVERHGDSNAAGARGKNHQISDSISKDALYKFACGIQRHTQIMGWNETRTIVEQRSDQFEEILTNQPAHEDARLKLNDSIELPEYYTIHDSQGRDDIHLVPGGYWGDALVGPVYELGGALYRTNWRGGYSDSPPGSLIAFAQGAPEPEYQRVLDLGCSFGALTMAYRSVYPDAEEVIGIDLSEAALRWAHHLARGRDSNVIFEQRNALSTGYEDEHFDLVTGFLLLHEIPNDQLTTLLTEIYRILRPGGHVRFLDVPPYAALPPERAYLQSFDAWGNGEAYWDDFLSTDLKAFITDVGFSDVVDGPLEYEEPAFKGSAALMRTAEFRPENRWVTSATKLAK